MANIPEWAEEIANIYRVGTYHQFLIDGNIRDLDFYGINKKEGRYLSVRQILIDLLFDGISDSMGNIDRSDTSGNADSSDTSIDHILYFSLSTGIREFSRQNRYFISPANEISVGNNAESILSKISINDDAPNLNEPLLKSLYSLDTALKTEWTYENGADNQDNNLKKKFRIGVIIDNAEHIIPDFQGASSLSAGSDAINIFEKIYSWGSDERIKKLKNICILLSSNRAMLPAGIRNQESGTYPISIPIPNLEKRQNYLKWIKNGWEAFIEKSGTSCKNYSLHSFLAQKEENIKLIANITKGYGIIDIKKIFDISKTGDLKLQDSFLCDSEPDADKICEFLDHHRKEIISSASQGLLEIITSTAGFDTIGGLEQAIKYFKRISKATLSDNEKLKKIIPKGVLLAGPPGTGKSLIAKALSNETKINLVRMGNIRSMWVGESEKNLALVLDLLKSMAPTIVFVDEIDQALGARNSSSGDSGVSGRIFQQILEFMGDNKNRGDVIWIAATNRADLLDDAMISRFDRIIPILLPGSKDEWKKVIQGISRQLKINCKDKTIDEFIDKSENKSFLKKHSGRSIETVVRLAYQNMLNDLAETVDSADGTTDGAKDDELTGKYLQQAFDTFKININDKMFELQTLLSITACNETTFIKKPEKGVYEYPFKGVDDLVINALTTRNNDAVDSRVDELKHLVRF